MQDDHTAGTGAGQAAPPPAPKPGAALPGAYYTPVKAPQKFEPMPLPASQSAAGALKKISYNHDAMIDLVIANPAISRGDIARHFGRTQAWVSQIFNSDAFQNRLAERKAVLIDPTIAASLEERMKAVTEQSLQILTEKLEATQSADMALEALKILPKALGYGAREDKVVLQQQFVVAMPQPATNEKAWVEGVTKQIGGGDGQ